LYSAVARVKEVSSVVDVVLGGPEKEAWMAEQHSDDVVRWRSNKKGAEGFGILVTEIQDHELSSVRKRLKFCVTANRFVPMRLPWLPEISFAWKKMTKSRLPVLFCRI
jgi:hypothetical protein